MTVLETWVQTPAAKALGETLVHSVWEGAVAAVALTAVLRVTVSSRARYAAACFAMLTMLAGFGLTFVRLVPQQRIVSAKQVRGITFAPNAFGRAPQERAQRSVADFLPWLAPIWIAGAVVFHLRSLASWIAAQRLRRRGVCCAPDLWQRRVAQLGARLGLSRPVVLLESCLADVPVVMGYLRPVILMPLALLTGLPAGQIESILLHELAHVRRCDYLVNLLQTCVEGILFYHPAMWWISRVIRAERENCCDDLVVATTGEAHEYAVALAALEQNRWAVRETALAATGGNLMKRIRRLLNQSERPRAGMPVFSAAILTITATFILAAWQTKPAESVATPYQKWADEDVVYIIDAQERATFKNLQSDSEREEFIRQFWLRRDPTPGTIENEFKEEHYRRIAYANERFASPNVSGWKTDQGRIYIIYGPADEIESHPKGGSYNRPSGDGGGTVMTYPFEQWRYRHIEGVGENVLIEFVDVKSSGDYRMTMDPREKQIKP